METNVRRTHERIQTQTFGNPQLITFGPFLPGEFVDSVTIVVAAVAVVTVSDAGVTISMTASSKKPANSAEAGAGRFLGDNLCYLPIGSTGPNTTGISTDVAYGPLPGPYNLPVNWQASELERFLTFWIGLSVGGDVHGGLWIRLRRRETEAADKQTLTETPIVKES